MLQVEGHWWTKCKQNANKCKKIDWEYGVEPSTISTRSNSITLLKGTHGVEASYVADHKKIEGKLDDLAAMVRTLTDLQKKPIPSTLCGICASTNHPTEACSMLKETGTLDNEQPQAYAANIYGNNRPPRQQYNHDLSSNKYNLDWKEYPSQKWGNQ